MIKIVTIQGSVRKGNYTAFATAIVIDELRKQPNVEVTAIDPGEYRLNFPGMSGENDSKKLQEIVGNAVGVILATPEYHGSYSSVIKLVIENLAFPNKLQGKPVSLLGVASGRIGAIKSLEHLRSVCSHVGALVLPYSISVANVQKVFDQQGNCLDEPTEKAIRSLATTHVDYIKKHICPSVSVEEIVRKQPVG